MKMKVIKSIQNLTQFKKEPTTQVYKRLKNYETPKIVESVLFNTFALACTFFPGDMECAGGAENS